MVVLKLMGDEWNLSEKIVIALNPQKPFNMSTTAILAKLGLDTWSGCCFYHTEGKPPNVVKPTVPISFQSNPMKEKLKDGAILYVKYADLSKQDRDIKFYESLVAWREEKGLSGIKPDGSDIEDFIFEYLNKLNVEQSEEISQFENEKRLIIEGEEARAMWALSFEFRTVQRMKDKENDARSSIVEAYELEVENLAKQLAQLIFAGKASQLSDLELPERAAIEKEEVIERTKLETNFQMTKPMPKVKNEQHVVGVGISSEQLEQLSSLILRAMEDQKKETERIVAAFTTKYSQMDEMVDEVKSEAQAIRDMVVRTAQEHNEATERIAGIAAKLTDDTIQERINELKMRSTEDDLDLLPNNQEAIDAMVQLLAEQNQLLHQLAQVELQKKKKKKEMSSQIATSVVTSSLQCVQSELMSQLERVTAAQGSLFADAPPEFLEIDLEGDKSTNEGEREEEKRKKGAHISPFSTSFCFSEALPLHPEVHQVLYAFLWEYLPLLQPHLAPDATDSVLPPPPPQDGCSSKSQRRQNMRLIREKATVEYLADLLLKCCSPYEAADFLCCKFQIKASPHRGIFLDFCELYRPHLVCVIDLILAVKIGREAETACDLFPTVAKSGKFTQHYDKGAGQPYYYHTGLRISQWLRPENYDISL